MSKERKTVDIWVIETNFSYGWECEIYEMSRKEGLEQLKTYRDNSMGKFVCRMRKRRIPKAKFESGDF